MLGGQARPWSRRTVERVIAAGLLTSFGRGKSRRVSEAEVAVLFRRLVTGEVVWPPSAKSSAATVGAAPSASGRKARGNGPRSLRSTDDRQNDAPLQSRPQR